MPALSQHSAPSWQSGKSDESQRMKRLACRCCRLDGQAKHTTVVCPTIATGTTGGVATFHSHFGAPQVPSKRSLSDSSLISSLHLPSLTPSQGSQSKTQISSARDNVCRVCRKGSCANPLPCCCEQAGETGEGQRGDAAPQACIAVLDRDRLRAGAFGARCA